MSKDSIPVSDASKLPELKWSEINDAIVRFMSISEHMKQLGFQVDSVARAALLTAMHLHLVEMCGDPFKANAQIISFSHSHMQEVCTNLQKMLEEAVKSGRVQSQKLNEKELENMKTLLVNMEMMLSKNHLLSVDEIREVLMVQQILASSVDTLTKGHNPIAVARALIVMAQQFMFFDMQADLLAAQTAFMDQQLTLWDIAYANAQNLIKAATEKKSNESQDKSN